MRSYIARNASASRRSFPAAVAAGNPTLRCYWCGCRIMGDEPATRWHDHTLHRECGERAKVIVHELAEEAARAVRGGLRAP